MIEDIIKEMEKGNKIESMISNIWSFYNISQPNIDGSDKDKYCIITDSEARDETNIDVYHLNIFLCSIKMKMETNIDKCKIIMKYSISHNPYNILKEYEYILDMVRNNNIKIDDIIK